MVQDFKNAPKMIDAAINRLVNKSVVYTMQLIQKRAVNLQGKFFSYLATSAGIIGRSVSDSVVSFPSVDGAGLKLGSSTWPQLDPFYNVRKKKGFNRFFYNTGALRSDLLRQNAITKFGMPMVEYFDQAGVPQASSYKTKLGIKTNPGLNKSGPLGSIEIDFFPRVDSRLYVTMPPNFYKKFFGTRKMGFKLDNEKAKRPFMGQYMEWWIKVKGRQILKGVA